MSERSESPNRSWIERLRQRYTSVRKWSSRILSGKQRSQNELNKQEVQRLRRRHWIRMNLAVGFVIVLLLILNTSVESLRSAPWQILFAVAYGVLCSVLASFLVFAYLAHDELRQLREVRPPGISLLGVSHGRSSDGDGRTVIVLPVFPVPKNQQDIEVHARLGNGQVVPVTLADIRHTAHSRRDMLVVHDILRLYYRLGLPRPLVLKDDDICLQLLDSQSEVGGLQLREDTDELDSVPHEISSIISLGLFSNKFTVALSQHPDVPFTLMPSRIRSERKLQVRVPYESGYPSQGGVGSESFHLPENEEEGPDFGLVARLSFRDVSVGIVGGVTALGTVRLGDFLMNNPSWSTKDSLLTRLATDRSSWPFCAIVRCPSQGQRHREKFSARVVYWDEGEGEPLTGLSLHEFARKQIERTWTEEMQKRQMIRR